MHNSKYAAGRFFIFCVWKGILHILIHNILPVAKINIVSYKPLLTRSLLVKVDFNFRSGIEINIVGCLDQSERSILRTGSNLLDVDPH